MAGAKDGVLTFRMPRIGAEAEASQRVEIMQHSD